MQSVLPLRVHILAVLSSEPVTMTLRSSDNAIQLTEDEWSPSVSFTWVFWYKLEFPAPILTLLGSF